MITVREMHKLVSDKDAQPLEIKSEQQDKLAVVHYVPAAAAATVTMVPLTQLKEIPNAKPALRIPVKPISPPATGKIDVYQQRKMMVAENPELFTALMKIRDKELQRKLLKVLNEHNTIQYRSIEVQTEPLEVIELQRSEIQPYVFHEIVTKSTYSSPSSPSNDASKQKESTTAGGEHTKKRRRKRKVALPQANKESRVAKQNAKLNKPVSLAIKNIPSQNSTNYSKTPLKRPRLNSLDISENSLDVMNIFDDVESEESKKQTQLNLIKDILLADIEMDNGLL